MLAGARKFPERVRSSRDATREKRKATQQYERSKVIGAPADEVLAWVAQIGNLPEYLPPIKEADRADGSEDRIWTKGEIPDRGEFEGEGYFRVFEEYRRIEWGAEVGRDYSGRLQVADLQDGKSEVAVQLYFGERSVEGEIQEECGEGRDPLVEGIDATLESIRRQIEEGSGKVKQPSATG
ncbi:MAG TPA: SRPBCC family protein [Rubrobacteraceae bacterium]|nr:SRPBCC family protein [Rubrobacteraceae bacterium]